MNERIRELAEQAGAEPTPFSNVLALVGNDIEKFAELIVRECAKRVDYWESRQGEHTDDILKHFGVERE